MKDKWALCNCFRNHLKLLGDSELWGLDCEGYCDERVTCGGMAGVFNRRYKIDNVAKEAVKR